MKQSLASERKRVTAGRKLTPPQRLRIPRENHIPSHLRGSRRQVLDNETMKPQEK